MTTFARIRSLDTSKTPLEYVNAFIGAGKGVRSVHCYGKSSCGHVSLKGIGIKDSENENENEGEDSEGILIDLERVKNLGSSPSHAYQQTPAVYSIAMEVLKKGVEVTCRHDLESLFHSFNAGCMLYGPLDNKKGKRQTKLSEAGKGILSKWVQGTYEEMAGGKEEYMTKDKFEEVLETYQEDFIVFKPLAREIRRRLFGDNGKKITTPRDPKMRQEMLDDFIELLVDFREKNREALLKPQRQEKKIERRGRK